MAMYVTGPPPGVAVGFGRVGVEVGSAVGCAIVGVTVGATPVGTGVGVATIWLRVGVTAFPVRVGVTARVGVRVADAVARVGVAVAAALRPRQTPLTGDVPVSQQLPSLSHEKNSKSDNVHVEPGHPLSSKQMAFLLEPPAQYPAQSLPVEPQVVPHCALLRQEKPSASPPMQTFCVATHAAPPAQLHAQPPPPEGPPAQVPLDEDGAVHENPCSEQVLAAQSQGSPSSPPPLHTPSSTTHTPPGQSASELHRAPSLVPPAGIEQRNSPSGVGVGVCAVARFGWASPASASRISTHLYLGFPFATTQSPQPLALFLLFHPVSQ